LATSVNGVATFSNISFSTPGIYMLSATDSSESAITAFSQPFIVTPIPALSSFVVNAGAAQRSMDNLLTLTFNQPMNLLSGAITLTQRSNSGHTPLSINFNTNSPDGGMTWNITFPTYAAASLPDGIYDLVINSSNVTSLATGQAMSGANQTFTFHRLFGDIDGNGSVDQADYATFLNSYGQSKSSPLYNGFFDYDGNGIINGTDYLQFKLRYGTSLLY
jgi:hypothetical protein